MSELFGNAAGAWWGWVGPVSLQVLPLAVVVALLDRLLARRAWPQLRAALWLVVALKLVVPPTLSSPVSLARVVPLPASSSASVPETSAVPAIFLAWLVGVLVFAAVTAWRYRGLRRRWLAGRPAPQPAWLAAAARDAADRLGLKRLPPVRLQPNVPGPAVVGFLRPVVVLPAGLPSSASREQVGHVLLHELAHVKRRDPLASLALLALQLLYWFHPLVWLARARLAALRELCCDQTVTGALRGDAPAYRRTLLELARPLVSRPAPGGLGLVHRHSQLLARLEWLERPLARRPHVRRAATAFAFAAIFACCVPLAPREAPSPVSQLPPLEDLEGCLQLRYAVFGLLAEEG